MVYSLLAAEKGYKVFLSLIIRSSCRVFTFYYIFTLFGCWFRSFCVYFPPCEDAEGTVMISVWKVSFVVIGFYRPWWPSTHILSLFHFIFFFFVFFFFHFVMIVYWPMIRLTSKTSICPKLRVEQSNLLYEANPVYYIGICFIFYSVWFSGNLILFLFLVCNCLWWNKWCISHMNICDYKLTASFVGFLHSVFRVAWIMKSCLFVNVDLLKSRLTQLVT